MRMMQREFVVLIAARCSRFAMRSENAEVFTVLASHVSQRRGYNI